MSGLDIESALYKFLNDNAGTLTTSRGDAIPVEWHAQGDEFDPPAGPYGTFLMIAPESVINTDKSIKRSVITQVAQDTPTFTTGTLEYGLTEKDVASVTQVSGTFMGGGHTFVEDVDYELSKEDGYSTFSAIKWLDGGDKPDNGTVFTVDYTENLLQESVRVWYFLGYRLMIHAPKYEVGANFYTKETLGMELTTAFMAKMHSLRGSSLITDTGKIHNLDAFSVPTFGEGELFSRHGFDLRISIYHDSVVNSVEAIGKWEGDNTYEV